jgi:hypothetical protein
MAPVSEENVALEAPRSSARLVGGLISDVQELVRQEIALVRQETIEDLTRLLGASGRLLRAGALLALSALSLVLALGQGAAALMHWPAWAGSAAIGLLLGAAGFAVLTLHRPAAKHREGGAP